MQFMIYWSTVVENQESEFEKLATKSPSNQ